MSQKQSKQTAIIFQIFFDIEGRLSGNNNKE